MEVNHMTEFQEDMIFKDIGEEDVEILLDIANKKSKLKKIWTKELRLIDPSTFKLDMIIELDDENWILEFQSTEVNKMFSKRALCYVALIDYKKENDKDVNLCVISTAEKSKTVSHRVNRQNTFNYAVIGNDVLDGEKIIREIEEKYNRNIQITRKECVYFALAPIMSKNGNLERNIKKTVDILISLSDVPVSTKNLCFGIVWLLVDKFVKDLELRNLLLDLLGDRMSAMYEYGERKEQNGKKQIIKKFYDSGMSVEEIARRTEIDIKEVEELLK